MVWSKVSIVLPSVPLDSAQWSPSKHMRPPDMVEGSLAEMWLLPSSQYHSATESLSWKHFQRWACPVAHSYLDHGPSSLKQNLRKYNLEAGAKASRPCPAPPPSSLSRVSEWAPRAQLGNPWSHLPHLCCPGNVSHQDKPCPHWKFICHDTTVQCSGGSAPQNHSGTQDYPIIWLHQFPSIPPAQREWLWRVAQEVYNAPTRIARARDQFHGSTKVHGKLGIVIWVPKKKRKWGWWTRSTLCHSIIENFEVQRGEVIIPRSHSLPASRSTDFPVTAHPHGTIYTRRRQYGKTNNKKM